MALGAPLTIRSGLPRSSAISASDVLVAGSNGVNRKTLRFDNCRSLASANDRMALSDWILSGL